MYDSELSIYDEYANDLSNSFFEAERHDTFGERLDTLHLSE
ncbi:hypothetical protein ACG7TL_002821 [Trametes sanguinea]